MLFLEVEVDLFVDGIHVVGGLLNELLDLFLGVVAVVCAQRPRESRGSRQSPCYLHLLIKEVLLLSN